MSKINLPPNKPSMKLIGVIGIVLLATLITTPVAFSGEHNVSVEERGENSIIITNDNNTPINATIQSDIFTYNATIPAGKTTIVPANSTDNVTIHPI